jgi:zinc transport system ATP-binding protein
MHPLLEVNNLSVKFGDVSVLEGVNFSLEKGDVMTIIGPNGAGKTMLVKSILGLVPYEGEVVLNGEPVSTQLSRIGYVPQRFDFDRTFPLTVKELLGLIFRKISAEEAKIVCQHLEIERLLSNKIGTLSGGQMQRVLIARAVMNQPQLLIMDEPTAGVDIGGVRNFYDIVRHLNEEHNMTIILVSHEINMVYSLASKVICLNKQMLCSGTPQKAITKKILDRLYGKNVGPKKHTHLH